MPYFPRTLNPGPDEGDPTYRASMLPFGTYPNADGSGQHLGFALPGMISEPVNALARLMGSPSHPGTFTQGPDYGSNADDMRTLLEAFLGGNATRGMGSAAMAMADHAPSLPGAVIAGAHMPPEIAAKVDWPALDGLPKNQGVDRLGSMFSGFYPQLRDSMISAKTGERLPPLNDKSPEPLSTYDAAALEQAWRNKIRQTGELYSDGLPSLWPSSLQPQQDQRYPNSLFTY